MRHPNPRLDPLLAPGETVLHEFRPDPAGAKSWGATLATALWSAPIGLLLLYLAVVQPRDFGVPWFLAAPAGLLVLPLAPAERAIARRRLHGMMAALTERQLLLLGPEGEPRGIGPYDIREVAVVPGPGRPRHAASSPRPRHAARAARGRRRRPPHRRLGGGTDRAVARLDARAPGRRHAR
jgi:hypothetical protein